MHQDPHLPDDRRAAGEPHRAGEPVRPFPSEAEWLTLPMPEPTELPHDAAAFTARTLQALREEAALDRDIERLDRELPRLLLSGHRAPAPSPGFLPRVLRALADDRRARWQQLLARHVAPEPSPQFVARTLAALHEQRRPDDGRGPRELLRGAGARRWQVWPLLAAAVIAVVWVGFQRVATTPLEARLARSTPAAFAHHLTASPLPAVLAARSRQLESDGLIVASADGLWLQLAEARR